MLYLTSCTVIINSFHCLTPYLLPNIHIDHYRYCLYCIILSLYHYRKTAPMSGILDICLNRTHKNKPQLPVHFVSRYETYVMFNGYSRQHLFQTRRLFPSTIFLCIIIM
jgi:hypothetical protein